MLDKNTSIGHHVIKQVEFFGGEMYWDTGFQYDMSFSIQFDFADPNTCAFCRLV